MASVEAGPARITPQKFILRVLASWLVMLALDLVLNAGLFAKFWLEPCPFLLSPRELFRRIPLGYMAFLLQAVAWVWLADRFGVRNWKQGASLGLKLGTLLNVAVVLGLRSGTTASWTLLLVPWLIGGVVLAAGAFLMAGFASERGEKAAMKRAFWVLMAAIVIIVIMQNTGLAPDQRLSR